MWASSRLIKGRLNKVMPEGSLEWALHGIKINGVSHGCSGFIRNKNNGVIVYINTDLTVFQDNNTILYRYAKDFKDYRGCQNKYTNEENFVEDIKRDLLNKERYSSEVNNRRW